MTWIDNRDQIDTSGGWLRRQGTRPRVRRQITVDPVYTVAEVAQIFHVTRKTVYKWLAEEDGDAVIPPEGWYKLPGSHYIRIYAWALAPLQQG